MVELGKKPCCNYTIIGFYPAKAYLLSEATAYLKIEFCHTPIRYPQSAENASSPVWP